MGNFGERMALASEEKARNERVCLIIDRTPNPGLYREKEQEAKTVDWREGGVEMKGDSPAEIERKKQIRKRRKKMCQSQLDKDLINDMYKIRRFLGWSLGRLAGHFKVDRSTLSNIENRKTSPGAGLRGKIALFIYENQKIFQTN